MDTLEHEKIDHNRAIWHSRRGMLELDLVLEPFVKLRYPELDLDTQARYKYLLECEDQQLFDWFLKKQAPPSGELAQMVNEILAYQASRELGF